METSWIYNAVYTATYNVNRKKNKRPMKLWQKRSVRKADKEMVRDNMSTVKQVEEKEGNSWIKKIYAANGLLKKKKKKKPKGEKDNG